MILAGGSERLRSFNSLEKKWKYESHFDLLVYESDIRINSSYSLETGEYITKKASEENYKYISIRELVKKSSHSDNNINSLLEMVCWWQLKTYWRAEFHSYSGLLYSVINDNIYIQHRSISTGKRIKKIINASKKKPELQHLLYNLLATDGENPNFLLYLLSRKESSSVAIYLIAQKSNSNSLSQLVNTNETSLHHCYWSTACDEFLDVMFHDSSNDDIHSVASVIIEISKKCIFHESQNNNRPIMLDQLHILLEKMSLKQIRETYPLLLEKILNNKEKETTSIPLWKFHLLFWFLEKDNNGYLIDTTFREKVQKAVFLTYKKEFTSDKYLDILIFFDYLPWHELSNKKVIDRFLSLDGETLLWIEKIKYSKKKHM